MRLFSKTVCEEVVLPFVMKDITPEASEACMVELEAYGCVLDEFKYCYVTVSFHPQDYDALVEKLTTMENKQIKVVVSGKDGIVKKFKFDFETLAEALHDSRLEKASLVAWRLSDSSVLKV